MNPPPKSIAKSKTIIVNAIIAGSAFIPGVQSFVQAHPDEVLLAIGVANTLLRLVTKGRVQLFAD